MNISRSKSIYTTVFNKIKKKLYNIINQIIYIYVYILNLKINII